MVFSEEDKDDDIDNIDKASIEKNEVSTPVSSNSKPVTLFTFFNCYIVISNNC